MLHLYIKKPKKQSRQMQTLAQAPPSGLPYAGSRIQKPELAKWL